MPTQKTATALAESVQERSDDSVTEIEHEPIQSSGARHAAPARDTETLTFTELVALANAWDPWGDPWNGR